MAELPTGTVTLLFTDIEGSTRLLRRVGDAYAGLLAQHRALLDEAFTGTAASWSTARATPSSSRSPRRRTRLPPRPPASAPWRSTIGRDGNEVRVRMGLHTGEPHAVDGRYVGLDVHHAARVMAVGHGGQVLVSEATRALLDDARRACATSASTG